MAKKLPKDIAVGDRLVLEDKQSVPVTASYPLGEKRWAVETKLGMIQLDPDVEVIVWEAP